MQTKRLCVLIRILAGVGLVRRFAGLGPPVKCFAGGSGEVLLFVDLLCFFVLCLLCICVRLFVCALWSPAVGGSWLSFDVSNCKFVTFPLVSWVRCDT